MTAKIWESAVKLSLNIEGGLSLDEDDKGNSKHERDECFGVHNFCGGR